MAFSLGKFNSPKSTRQLNPEDHQPQFSHFVPNLNPETQFKQKILLQNKALARKNSILMTKISDLEAKVSELIQQNIELRAVNAKSEDRKRKWLEDKLEVIEEGVNQRFGEMIQMFQTIRTNEGLPQSNLELSTLMIGGSHSSGENTTDKSVSFQIVKSPKKQSKSERRRKSQRRQSIYVSPSDSVTINEQSVAQFDRNVELFPSNSSKFELPPPKGSHTRSATESEDQEKIEGEIHVQFDEENPFQEQSYEQIEEIIQQHQAETIEQAAQGDREAETSKFSESFQEMQSMELTQASLLSPVKKYKSPAKILSPGSLDKRSKKKILVYEDTPDVEEDLTNKIKKLASSSVHHFEETKKPLVKKDSRRSSSIITKKNDETTNEDQGLSGEQKQSSQDTDKVKHTKAQKQKSRFVIDEKMPGTNVDADELSSRRSRTRGRQVSYAEPSLRAKMRRQSEKFVAATDDEAYDAYVNNVLVNRRKTITPEVSRENIEVNKEVEIISPQEMNKEEQNKVSNSQLEKPSNTCATEDFIQNAIDSRVSPIKAKRSLIEQDSMNITKRRKPLSTLNSNKIAKKDSDPMQKIKTKSKVYEDENNEGDLSVFDLVEESSAGVPKTTYKGNPDIKLKRKNSGSSRRHSMLL